jgi:hypothetical protein
VVLAGRSVNRRQGIGQACEGGYQAALPRARTTGQAAAALWCCLTEPYGEVRGSARARLEKVIFLAPATILFG